MLPDRPLARLRPPATRARNLDALLVAVARAVRGFPGRGSVKVTTAPTEEAAPDSWTISHRQGAGRVARSSPGGTATIEIVATEATLVEIMTGSRSPLDAFMKNQLRVRGDVDYGRALLRHLAARRDMRTEICD